MKYTIGDIVKYRFPDSGIKEGVINHISTDVINGVTYTEYKVIPKGKSDSILVSVSEEFIVDDDNIDQEDIEFYEKFFNSNILNKVNNVLLERAASHGDYRENFNTIARLWSDYLDLEGELRSKDVAMMMILLKIARAKGGNSSEDDFIDMIGYAKLGSEL